MYPKSIFQVNGKPFYPIGVQAHNNSGYTMEQLEPVWEVCRLTNSNSCAIAVAWERIEPVEGQFDLYIVRQIVRAARERDLKLVILWFGTWKNGHMKYVPRWVKEDHERFPRVRTHDGYEIANLSTFEGETLEADKRAFCAMMQVLREEVVCPPNNGQSKRLVQILCGKYPFKLNRSTVAQRLVNPASVVKQHVFRNRVRRLFARPEILTVEPFHLQRLEERLGTGIIIRRARAAHTLYSADFLNFVPEIPRCILAAAIGMDYQFSLRPSVHYRVSKRSYRKPTVQHTAYCPANYSPTEQVYECAQIQPSFVSRHIREIRYPFLIRLVCLEILPQQILKWLCFRVGYGCTYTLAPCYWHKSCHGHQSPHALPAYIFADFAQFHLDFPTSVDALAPEKDVFNLHGQVTISYFTRAVFSSLKLIVSLSACL